ncbi:HAD family hydrolase [Verrucomicrobiota bacterium sgz303538]
MDDKSTISAIAWDLDNTLFDRDKAFRAFFSSWLKREAYGLTSQEHESALDRIRILDRSGYGDRLKFCERVMAMVGVTRFKPEQLWEEIQTRLPDFITPDIRVLKLLESLAPHFRMVIVTNGGSVFQRAKIASSGLSRIFSQSEIFVSSELGISKPEPAIFEMVLSFLQLSAEQVLFVGDHVVNDIEGPANVGMRTCWVSNGRSTPKDLKADLVVTTVHELNPSMVRSLSLRAAA